MGSKLGWVDFAETDRQKMMDVVQLYRDRDTRDELGIGTIRDAFSDYFFPGTSTVQRRVKYMLFVPWIYLDLEKKKISSEKIAQRARYEELKLIENLIANGEGEGVIGLEARKDLQRLPSSIYWTGLSAWRIRFYPGSQDEYHRHLNVYYQRKKTTFNGESDQEYINPLTAPNWHPGIPEAPDNLAQQAFFKLNREEAQYLRERVCLNHPSSFLARLIESASSSNSGFPWESPFVNKLSEKDLLKNQVWHAWNFSEAMHGASLLYNLLLSKARENQDGIDDFENRFINWTNVLRGRKRDFLKWYNGLDEFWHLPVFKQSLIPRSTQIFVSDWLKLAFDSPGYDKLLSSRPAMNLISNREYQLKRNRARLQNKRALEMWRGESGTRQLSYRWQTATTFVSDILQGLRKG